MQADGLEPDSERRGGSVEFAKSLLMEMKRGALDLHVGNERAGLLTRSAVREAEFLFTYERGTGGYAAVSLTMPVVPDQYDALNTVLDAVEQTRRELRRFARAHRDFAGAAQALTSVFDQQAALLRDAK